MGTDGRYGYGEDGEGAAHEVRVSSFAISRCAITNAQFAVFVDATGYRTEAERFGWSFVFGRSCRRISLPRGRRCAVAAAG